MDSSGSEVGGGDFGGAATLSGKGENFNLSGARREKRLVGLMGKGGGNRREPFLAADDDRGTTGEVVERGWSRDMLSGFVYNFVCSDSPTQEQRAETDDFFTLATEIF